MGQFPGFGGQALSWLTPFCAFKGVRNSQNMSSAGVEAEGCCWVEPVVAPENSKCLPVETVLALSVDKIVGVIAEGGKRARRFAERLVNAVDDFLKSCTCSANKLTYVRS